MKRKYGLIRAVIILLFAVFLLYFMVGDGKTQIMKRAYPLKYQEYVERYSDEYSLDKYLVYAVMKVESGFDADAVSNVGAKGLMQLMDKTALECNEKAGFGYEIPGDLFAAEKNIRIGCYYLKTLMDTYQDSTLAITAYNGGTGNVRKWLSDNSLSDGEGGLVHIPYKETRNYVKRVFKVYDIYVNLYKENDI